MILWPGFDKNRNSATLNLMNPFPIMLAVAPAANTVGFAAFNANLGADRYEILSRAWRFGVIYPRARAKDPQFLWQDAFSRLRSALPWQPSHLASSWPGLIGKAAVIEEACALSTAGMVGYVAGRFGLRPLSISLWRAEQWKGIAPRYTTKEKFLRLFGSGAQRVAEEESAETIEAIMIAEFWLTLYHRGKFTWQHQVKQRGRQVESHEAHNLESAGSIPAPAKLDATNNQSISCWAKK
jgi:hypothetical protein